MRASPDTLQALFLTELSALDAFAARREAEVGLLPGREDPDVRRLIEAMAFFSARTRAAAAVSTRAAVRRIAAGTLDDLLAPSPAAILAQAVPDAGLKEAEHLPQGTLLRATTPEGKVGLFATARPLTILPIALEGASLVEVHRRLRVTVKVSALHPRPMRGAVDLGLHVRRLNDYRASLALHDALEQHLSRAYVVADGDGREAPCRVTFGAARPRRVEDEPGEPEKLSQIRSFFHHPEQDLDIHVAVPAGVGPWSALAVHFELDDAFPSDMAVPADAFHLGVVPAYNAWGDFAEPILADGTKDVHVVRSSSAVLHDVGLDRVRGVYRSGDRGLVPVLPAALAQGGDTYELALDDEGELAGLRLSLEGAFEKPVKVIVDGRWSQPGLWSAAVGRLSLGLQTRHLPAVSFRALGPVRRPAESPLARDPARCLDVLSLRMRPALGRRDLVGMLELLGTGGDGPFRGAHALIDELSSAEASDPARRAGGIRRVYRLALRQKSPEDAPLVRRLSAQIAALLDAWTEDPVDIEITTRADDPRRAPALGERA